MSRSARSTARFIVVFAVLATVGTAAAAYVLVQQRAPVPFRDTYRAVIQFTKADGVVRGLGQPVNVVGVKVGQVVDVELVAARANVTVEIERSKVPRIHGDARAVLEPITPLKDMQINLDPGTPAGGTLVRGTIPVSGTAPPVPLADLLSTLDGDTRTFLQTFLASLDRGTAGRGDDLRRTLATLGPSVEQTGRISRALGHRRRALARLIHNVSAVARAATRDDQLKVVIAEGNRTLSAMGAQQRALASAVEKLPPTLRVTRETLEDLRPFAATLRSAARSLAPGVRRLPAALEALGPFSDLARSTLDEDVRPLVRDAQPLARKLGPVMERLAPATPQLTVSTKTVNYLLNELAYNAPGDDEGFLFWLGWFGHNFNSLFSTADAHGGIGRAARLVTCDGLERQSALQDFFGVVGLCPK